MAHLHHHGRCSTNPDRDATKPAVVQSGVIQGDHATVVEVLTGDAGGGGVKSNGRVDVTEWDRMGPGDDDGIEGGEGVDAGVRVEKEKRRRTWGNSRQGKAKGG
ncbi:hypothetical protein BHE74_00059591 [Ensete ventricosum]|nr:hypothetical protein BHE74_00059591 [Ensete ventricosum]